MIPGGKRKKDMNRVFKWAISVQLLMIASLSANTDGVIYKNLAWKASDTKTGVKVNGEIVLNVCWDASSFSGLTIPGGLSVTAWQKTVKDHISQWWNGYAGIRFVFTDINCDVIVGHDDREFKVGTTEFWAPNSAQGSSAISKVSKSPPEPSTILCWTYNKYNPTLIQTGTFSTSTNTTTYAYNAGYHKVALLAQAIHEFGHLLGLAHEQNHVGKPASCEFKVDNLTSESLGEYDESSIMNYCNTNYARRQSTPSCGDIASIRTMYGKNPNENKEPDCINECASGLEPIGLTKTGEILAGCKLPVNRIMGTMTDYPIRAMLFDNPESQTTVIPSGTPGTEYPVVVGSAVTGATDAWNIKFEIANPNTVMFPNSVKVMGASYFNPATNAMTDIFRNPNYNYAPLFPKSITLPKGTGAASKPSGLHFTVTQSLPKKVILSSYEYVIVDFESMWPKYGTPYYIYFPDFARVNLTPRPESIDYFNTMNSSTKVFAKPKSLVPAKYADGLTTIKPFFMDSYEVTQKDYMAIMKEFPFYWPGEASSPAEGMTFYDAILYCNKRSALEGLAPVYTFTSTTFSTDGNCTGMLGITVDEKKNGYRLPNQAEWIHAFRSGTTTDFYWGNLNTTNPLPYGWSLENSGKSPHPVGKKLPNQWGLHDMYGNVKEWTMEKNWGPNTDPYDFQCALGSDYSWESKYAAGDPMGSYNYSTCGSAGSRWAFIGFRPVRNAVFITPVLNLLLN
ncbi:MAG: serine/threonine kinase [Fibrobacteres bacterium]|nr:serine/threonine kinase [Fibrobacterota bacterium]